MPKRGRIWIASAFSLSWLSIAEAQYKTVDPSAFSNAERIVIERNVAMMSIVNDHPKIVRRLLNALADLNAGTETTNRSRRSDTPAERSPKAFDPEKNPDVDTLQRASPEAVHDLFQLLKQVKQTKPSTSR
jgi:hypothetical protein